MMASLSPVGSPEIAFTPPTKIRMGKGVLDLIEIHIASRFGRSKSLLFGLKRWGVRREAGHTIHGKEKAAFRRNAFGQFLCVVGDRVEGKAPHAWWEFRVPFAIRNSNGALE